MIIDIAGTDESGQSGLIFDAEDRYTVEQWIYNADMVEASTAPVTADKLVIEVDSQTTTTEWRETLKILNAGGDIIGYRYTRSGTKPSWVA